MILLYPIPYCYMVSFDVIRQSLSRSPSDKPERYKYIPQHTYSGGVLFLVSTNGIRRLQAIDLSLSEQSQKNSAVLSLFSERRNSEELAHRLQETIRTGKCD